MNITAEEFQAKCNTLIPRFRNDADKAGNDRRVEKVLHVSSEITVSFENLKAKCERTLNDGLMSVKKNLTDNFLTHFVHTEGIKVHRRHELRDDPRPVMKSHSRRTSLGASPHQGSELNEGKIKHLMGCRGAAAKPPSPSGPVQLCDPKQVPSVF